MNINTLVMKMRNFNELIVDSGFLRNVTEYIKTIAQPENSQNLILLQDITQKVIEQLNVIQESDLPDDLDKLLPQTDIETLNPFKDIELLTELLADTAVDTLKYHARLTNALNKLQTQINSNKKAIDNLYKILEPYYKKEREISEKAVMSFIFKDKNTITNLKKFAETLNRWNRTLYIYHQLVSRKTPEDTQLVNIQSGTLNVILNLDVNIALDFTEIVKYGFLAFNGYLLYKAKAYDIVKSYFGNKKLLEMEKEREAILLDNIGKTIKGKLLEQHESLKEKGEKIEVKGVDKIIDEISNVLSEHIVKGNDIKLLADIVDDDAEKVEKSKQLIKEAMQASLVARNHLKKLPPGETQILIEKYTIKEEE